MESLESIEVLGKRLVDHFGTEWNGLPIWRIVWSEDQLEKRYATYEDYSPEGIYLRSITEWREVPKYRQWIHEKYVLERLVAVPDINISELTTKMSYEPIYVFMDKSGFPLPPKWEASKFIIDTVYAAMGKSSLGPKYVDPDKDSPIERRNERISQLQEDLFGDETEVGDALRYKQGIVVPSNYKE